MKRCPECRRDYYDDTLSFCLDDGIRLLEGPASGERFLNPGEAPTKLNIEKDHVTAILPIGAQDYGNNARLLSKRKIWILACLVALLATAGFFAFSYFSTDNKEETSAVNETRSAATVYWQMTEAEQMAFIQERARHVQTLIGDEPAGLDEKAVKAIKVEIDDYVEEKDSLSQEPFEEGLRIIYGRASQYAPLVSQAYEAQKVPAALGLYQAMIESEYHDCPDIYKHPRSPVGLFQFSRKTAALYGLRPEDYCDVPKQCEAAARHMSDLISDFGSEKSSWTLALFSFNQGGDPVRDYLRQLRGRGITERSFWAVLRHHEELEPVMTEGSTMYVPRFFAAAIIGETPQAFELSTPPLTALR